MPLKINTDSILSKAKKFMGTDDAVSKINDIKRDVMSGKKKLSRGSTPHTPDDAANKFVEVLKQEIDASGVSRNVADAIDTLRVTGASYNGDGSYDIMVYFEPTPRLSLIPEKYGYISDLALLYNDGVDHIMHQVWGDWHGRLTGSLTTIPGAGFMESAIDVFMDSYADEYNVTNIKFDR